MSKAKHHSPSSDNKRLTFRQRIEQPILLNLSSRIINSSRSVQKKQDQPKPQTKTPEPIIIRRGKERPPERPAKKKQSTLKKIILKERTDRSERSQIDWKATIDNEEEIEKPRKSDLAVYREYCRNRRSHELDEDCCLLLKLLVDFQSRAYAKNKIKARYHRRYIVGLRQILKRLKAKQVRLVIIAPDCEPTNAEGGLDDIINRIFEYCEEQRICCAFALNRKALGKCTNVRALVAAVGILDYSGAELIYKRISEHVKVARIEESTNDNEYSTNSSVSAYLDMSLEDSSSNRHIRNLSDSFGVLRLNSIKSSERTNENGEEGATKNRVLGRPMLLAKHTRNASAEVTSSMYQSNLMIKANHSRNPSEISQTSQAGCAGDYQSIDEYYTKVALEVVGEKIPDPNCLTMVLEESNDPGNDADDECEV